MIQKISIDSALKNQDWIKANAFDFPSVKNLADFERAMFIPSEPLARRTKLASYAGMAWFPVAPDDIRHAIIEAARQQDLVKMLKSKGLPALEKSKLKDDVFMVLVAEKLSKVSFGGDRSEAGRYAANMRWKGKGKESASQVSEGAVSDNLREQIGLIAGAMKSVADSGVTIDNYRREDIGANGIKQLKAEVKKIENDISRVVGKMGKSDATERGYEAVRLANYALDTMKKKPSERNLATGTDELLVSRDANGTLVGLAMTFTSNEEHPMAAYKENEQDHEIRLMSGRVMSLEYLVSFQTVKGVGRALFGEIIKRSADKNVLFTYLETTDQSQPYWEKVGFKFDPYSPRYSQHKLVTTLDDVAKMLP